jgi:hypothetical protein
VLAVERLEAAGAASAAAAIPPPMLLELRRYRHLPASAATLVETAVRFPPLLDTTSKGEAPCGKRRTAEHRRIADGRTRIYACFAFAREVSGKGLGVSTCPVPHPWDATSCRNQTPLSTSLPHTRSLAAVQDERLPPPAPPTPTPAEDPFLIVSNQVSWVILIVGGVVLVLALLLLARTLYLRSRTDSPSDEESIVLHTPPSAGKSRFQGESDDDEEAEAKRAAEALLLRLALPAPGDEYPSTPDSESEEEEEVRKTRVWVELPCDSYHDGVPEQGRAVMRKLRIVMLGFGTGRHKRVLERWTNPKLPRRACTCEYALQSWRGKSAGVAKRPREPSPEIPTTRNFSIAEGRAVSRSTQLGT